MTPVRPVPGGVRLTLHVRPRAARTETAGLHGDALRLWVAAPPVEGAANEEIVRFVATALGVPRARVTLVSGGTSRRKVVEVAGVDAGTAAAALGLA